MNISLLPIGGDLGAALGLVFIVIGAIVHIGFALSVWADAANMVRYQQRSTFLLGGTFWALATLMGGVFVVGVYWLIHHSNLRSRWPPKDQG